VTRFEELKQEKLVRVVHREHERAGWCVIAENGLCRDLVWVPDRTLHKFTGLVVCCVCGTPRVHLKGWRPHPGLRDDRWMCSPCQEALPVFDPHDPSLHD
jgi:hypothetical protein